MVKWNSKFENKQGYEMLHETDEVTKRTPGICNKCGAEILPGEKCFSVKVCKAGRWYSNYYCVSCHDEEAERSKTSGSFVSLLSYSEESS